MLHAYSITPLDMEHIDELCEDIRSLWESRVSTPLFYVKLHAEGKPAIDKVTKITKDYLAFKERLDEMGVPSGILIQSSIGHGYVLDNPITYTPLTMLDTGEETFTSCPLDPEWREYFKDVVRKLAACHPVALMLDDDFRLMNRPGMGCACPHHMAEFNRRAGTNLTREELWEHIKTHPLSDRLSRIFTELQHDTLRETAEVLREAVDEVDPTIQGINCTSGAECEGIEGIIKAWAGRGNPTIVRVPNGTYAPPIMRTFPELVLRSARAVKCLKNIGIDIILAETDTIPFNRYGKCASTLQAQFVSDILDGCTGAKHWFTRLLTHEPKSGKAYRKILAENTGLYDTLAELAPKIRWIGSNVPFAIPRDFDFHRDNVYDWTFDNWAFLAYFLGRIGVPVYFDDECATTSFLSGPIEIYSDEDLDKIFSGNVILTSNCVSPLRERGYGDKIGVSTRNWEGDVVSGELLNNGAKCPKQYKLLELCPESDKVEVGSVNYHLTNGVENTPLFPATTIFHRPDGKVTITFCGTPEAPFTYTDGFSFLNESRKEQVVSLLRDLGTLPLYYTGDADVFLRAGELENGDTLIALWNLGWDILEDIPMSFEGKSVVSIERLNNLGEREKVDFTTDGLEVVIQNELKPILPEIFIVRTH